jgi:hypothetical protein
VLHYGIMSLEITRFFEQNPELLQAFADTFIARFDTYPYQLPDGSYIRAHANLPDGIKQYHSLQTGHLESHLTGQHTLGVYMLNPQSETTRIVLDDDSDNGLKRLQEIGIDLQRQGLPSYLEQSRRGGHLWVFTPPLSGRDARRVAKYLLGQRELTSKDIEIYPKQDFLHGDHVGSLVRLPFGKHLKTGKVYGFIDFEGHDLADRRRDQLAIVAHPERFSQEGIDRILAAAPEAKKTFQIDRNRLKRYSSDMPPDVRIKRAISPVDYISQYVELDHTGRGLCPFHDDHKQSLKVYDDGWHCFAGCEGNTIIDFYLKMRGYSDLKLSPDDWKHELHSMMKQIGL